MSVDSSNGLVKPSPGLLLQVGVAVPVQAYVPYSGGGSRKITLYLVA